MRVEEYCAERRAQVNRALEQYLDRCREPLSRLLFDAIAYALEGGKRLRPILVLAGAELFKAKPDHVMPTAMAFELLHTYSLIHDDLPCMDDDALRRGRPTVHKKYGEAVAVLAGDSLIPMAFSLIAEEQMRYRPAEPVLHVLQRVAITLGPTGLTGGQLLDLILSRRVVDGCNSSDHALNAEEMPRRKTASLLVAAAQSGAILAGAQREDCARLGEYGEHLGLAYQLVDDVIDQEGSVTSPDRARAQTELAVAALSLFGPEADALRDLARMLLMRQS